MIYFDNAATGGFKPSQVIDTAVSIIKFLNANPGRSGHRLSKTAGEYVYSCRKKLAEFFGAPSPSRVIFTKNCTESLNIAIHGSIKGGRVLTSTLEHNSVLRPLFTLQEKGVISLTVIKPSNDRFITLDDVKKHYSNDVSAVCLNAVSNVTGEECDLYSIGEFIKDKNSLFIVDGAQAGGHTNLSVKEQNIDMLCLAGHKGLYSIQGVGALILSERANPTAIYQGGTGTESFNPYQPDCYPEKLESGTLNLPAVCSLEEGVRYVEKNIEYIGNHLQSATSYLISHLEKINGVKVYSQPNKYGIVSFEVKNLPSSEVSEILSSKYDIAVRSGYHCAPLVHKMLKTENDGLVRASISLHNTRRELNALILAIREINSL
ncbi:MAG: aminotransferase class V-fold PLP-dependent enzyme [Clostridiales bacterium]|nr:aminotransferase class V-fold PLP-dependent enzyme [Clostridiales bacterium]